MTKKPRIEVAKLGSFTGHKDCIYTVERGTQSGEFFSGGSDGLVARWNLQNPDEGDLAAKIPNTVYALRYVPEQHILLAGQNFSGMHVIDCNAWKETTSIKLSSQAIFDIKHQDKVAFVSSGEGVVQAVALEDPLRVLWKQQASTESARCLAIHPSRPELAVGYSDNHIRILDMQTGEVKQTIEAHSNSVFTVVYTPDGKHLLSGSRDAYLRIWDTGEEGYSFHAEIVAHLFTLNHIAFRADGKYFATCSKDKSIKLWETENFRLRKVIDKSRYAGHGTSVNKLLWVGPNRLLSGSDDRSVAAWGVSFAD